jgi:putative glycosyltransferase (TIGR04372 family)
MLINGLWAVPSVLLMRALRPIVLVRLGTLESARIGHFVIDGAEQLARYQQQPANTSDWFWLGKTCNSQWERMIRRALPVHAWVKYVDRWNKVLPGGSAHERPSSYTRSRDVEGLYARHDVKIPFLPAESTEALTWLRSKGWKDGEPFVCLLVRDDEYLAQDSLHGNGNSRACEGWSYHDYRNSDIDTYVPAIQWLAAQGVWVIRMGKLMAKPLPTGMDHVIDYAFDPGKSDLLDIWLFANCNGCISTATGPDTIPLVYGKPILFVNALPLAGFSSFSNSIWVPKPLRWIDSGQLLSITEHLTNGFTRSVEYAATGIDILDMTSSQITSAVQELWQRIAETWLDDIADNQRQSHFWDICMEWPEYSELHGVRHPDSRVGSAWLRTLDETDSRSSDL